MRTTQRSVVELLQCHLRAAELEIRAVGEPFRSGLDVAGSKAHVLWRIEELDAREREREELVAELVPAIESRGYQIGGDGSKREGRECKEDIGRTERF